MIYIYVSALSLPKLYAFGQIPKLLEDSFFVFVKWGLEVTKRPFHFLTFNGSMEFFFLCLSLPLSHLFNHYIPYAHATQCEG